MAAPVLTLLIFSLCDGRPDEVDFLPKPAVGGLPTLVPKAM